MFESSKRKLNLLLGLLCVGIGILGAILPVLPSTCFFLLATYFFGKSSERLENWMLNHPRWGHAVRSWQATRSISMTGKIAASCGMLLSAILILLSPASWMVKGLSFVILAASFAYVFTRPTLKPVQDSPTQS